MKFNSQFSENEIIYTGDTTTPTNSPSVYLGGNAGEDTTTNVVELLKGFNGRIIVSTDSLAFPGTPDERRKWERIQKVQAEKNGALVLIYDKMPNALEALKLGEIIGAKNPSLQPHEARRIILFFNGSFQDTLLAEINSINENIVIINSIELLTDAVENIAVYNICEHV